MEDIFNIGSRISPTAQELPQPPQIRNCLDVVRTLLFAKGAVQIGADADV